MRLMLVATALLASRVVSIACAAQSAPARAAATGDCRLAGQVLETGHPANKRDWALHYVLLCPDEGPAHLVSLWNSPPSDTLGLRDLVFETARYRDRRIYDKARATAQNQALPDPVRVSAMIVLARMTNPRVMIELWDLRYREYPGGYIRLLSNTAVHAVQDDGAQALGNVDKEVLMLLQRIAADREREPQSVWYGAAVLARRVEWDTTHRRAGEN